MCSQYEPDVHPDIPDAVSQSGSPDFCNYKNKSAAFTKGIQLSPECALYCLLRVPYDFSVDPVMLNEVS